MKIACERCEKVMDRATVEGRKIEWGGLTGYLCRSCFDEFLEWLDGDESEEKRPTIRKMKQVEGCLAYADGQCLMLASRPVTCGGMIGAECEVEPEKREAFGIE